MWVGGDERWFHISPRRRKQCVSYEQGTAAQAAVPQPGLTQRIRSGPYKLVSDAEQVETAASLRRALEEASLGHTSRRFAEATSQRRKMWSPFPRNRPVAPALHFGQCHRAARRGAVYLAPLPLPLGEAARYWALAPTHPLHARASGLLLLLRAAIC